MSTVINQLQNILAQQLHGTLLGPILASQAWSDEHYTMMDVFECECANGSRIQTPLPFGMFATVIKGNMNKARLIVQCAPGFFDTPSNPVFSEVCSLQRDINEMICSASVCYKVVAIDATPESGTNIWTSEIKPIDLTHGLRVTIKNVTSATLTEDRFDDNFNTEITVSRTLVQTKGSPSTSVTDGVATHITYHPYKCGWWIRQTETFTVASVGHSYETNERFYWPPVLRELEFMTWNQKSKKNEGEVGGMFVAPRLFFNPEGYEGLCECHVEVSWSLTAVDIPEHEQMMPSRIYYASPLFTLNCPECLHVDVPVWCDFGTQDENWFFSAGSLRIFNATNMTEWPTSIVGADTQQPYKGGFLRMKKTFFPPPHDTSNTPDWTGWPEYLRPTIEVGTFSETEAELIITPNLGVGETLVGIYIMRATSVTFSDVAYTYVSASPATVTTAPDTRYYIKCFVIYQAAGGYRQSLMSPVIQHVSTL